MHSLPHAHAHSASKPPSPQPTSSKKRAESLDLRYLSLGLYRPHVSPTSWHAVVISPPLELEEPFWLRSIVS